MDQGTIETPVINVGGGTDLNSIISTVKAAQAASGGDKAALAKILREKLGASVVMGDTVLPGTVHQTVTVDPLDRLEKLSHLRDTGVLTQAEFETQKAKILAEGF
jgi:predicted PP-loop superfamily ATPase